MLARFTEEQVHRFIDRVSAEGRELDALKKSQGDMSGDPWNEILLLTDTAPRSVLHARDRVEPGLYLASSYPPMDMNGRTLKDLAFSTDWSSKLGVRTLADEVEFAWYLHKTCDKRDLLRVPGTGSCLFEALYRFLQLPFDLAPGHYTPMHLRLQLIVCLIFHRWVDSYCGSLIISIFFLLVNY